MNSVSVNVFRDKLKSLVEQVIDRHEPLKVTRRAGEDFVVMSAEDYEREQETLYVLQNASLMQQIGVSVATHQQGLGRQIAAGDLHEILGV